jgi:hypothetical protein
MTTKVAEQDKRRVGDRGACSICAPAKKDEVPACDVWGRSLELANGKPALKGK